MTGTSPRRRRPLILRLVRNPLGGLALAYLLLLLVVAVAGPFLVPYPPTASSLPDVFAPPSAEHLLGADSAGRDVLSRIVVASTVSLAGAAIAVLVAAAIGIPAGLLAGYRGGLLESAASGVTALVLGLPGIVVLLAVRAVAGPSIWLIMAVFGVLLSPAYFRVVFNAVRAVRAELYIDAAVLAGLSDARIIGRHILSAVRAPAVLLTSGVIAVSIAIQATLDFLGLGDSSLPTWGGILSEGFLNIFRAPTLLIWPSLAIGLTCVAFALLGIALRDELQNAPTPVTDARSTWSAPAPRPAAPLVHGDAEGAAGAAVLDVRDLAVAYARPDGWTTVVDGVDLRVGRGEVHALIGESGSGKTQTAWAILGLLPAGGRIVSGSVRFDGTELRGMSAPGLRAVRGRRIGYVPQEPLSNLDPSFTIGSQLVEPLRLVLGLSRRAARERALELLDRVGIDDPRRVFGAHPHEISGGMAQRVLIAGAISCEPQLLIADEPTTALDVTVQAEILELLRELQRESGAGMLLVTHNFGVVADLADRVSVMRSGSIVEAGPVGDVFRDPQHAYTRGLFDALLDRAPARAALPGETR